MKKLKTLFTTLGITAFVFALPAQDINKIEQGELVPLGKLRPLSVSEMPLNKHGINAGVSTSNSGYFDSSLNQMLFLGFYRPYATYLMDENHLFTLRGKWAITEFTRDIKGSNNQVVKTRADASSSVGSLEVASAELHFNRLNITAGRAFYKLGRGLLFGNFADGAEVSQSFRWFEYKVLAVYSGEYGQSACGLSVSGCGGRSPYDIVPGRSFDAQLVNAGKRVFGGGEITSAPYWGSRLSAQFLYTKDFNTDANKDGKKFTYDAFYAGLAARGFIGAPSLRYMLEYAYQGGSTINDGAINQSAAIGAHALQMEVAYNPPFYQEKFKPMVIAQYAFASGDSDRNDGTNAAQVNTKGNDTGFYHFGIFSGGLALKPRLQNIHVARVGIAGRPLGNFYALRNLML
ncbi:MAG TPA: alginate export family protein, partial [Turneriella sp.]|nr:alginate export family protein [Turneriella sp.]